MNLLAWLLFGLIVGIVGGALDEARSGLMKYMVLGVTGALAGGLLANSIFNTGYSGFNAAAFVIASFGAIAVLF